MFAFDVGNDCRYQAKVNGSLQPVQSKGAETRYRPDLDVWAKLSCPNATAIEDSDGVRSDQTFTRDDLARMISFRASFFRNEGSKKCAYVPEVDFDGKDVKANKVSYLCPAPSATGGGPR